jgi:hypothetical protein
MTFSEFAKKHKKGLIIGGITAGLTITAVVLTTVLLLKTKEGKKPKPTVKLLVQESPQSKAARAVTSTTTSTYLGIKFAAVYIVIFNV